MKKILICSLTISVMVVFVSCTKDHTCRCEIEISGGGVTSTTNFDTVFVDSKKAGATAVCEDLSSSAYVAGLSVEQTCALLP